MGAALLLLVTQNRHKRTSVKLAHHEFQA